jgi:DNA-binding response OmpR family regulator
MDIPLILAVGEDALSIEMLEYQLTDLGYSVFSATNGQEACSILSSQSIDLVLTDIVTPDIAGMDIMKQVRSQYSGILIIAVVDHGSIESVVAATRHGAYDYLEKPCHPLNIRLTVQRALEHRHVFQEDEQTRCLLQTQHTSQNTTAADPNMKEVLEGAAEDGETSGIFMIRPEGLFNHDRAVVLNRTIRQLIEEGYINFVLDMSLIPRLTYDGAYTLLSILIFINHRGGDIKLVAVPAEVQDKIIETKLHRLFDMFDTYKQAIASIKESR